MRPFLAVVAVLAVGIGLLCAGIYLVAGLGWSLIAGSIPFLAAAFVLIRGLSSV